MSNATQSLASTRITSLLDANSFVEIGKSVTARSTDFNMTEKKAPSDGVITGYGVIDGNLVYVYSQDASVLNGTVGEMHAKKISALYDLAIKTGAPVIGLVDCAGMRLQEATDALEAFGGIYFKQTMASGMIPQITAVFGTCGGGMAVVPALTDFTFIEAKKGKMFVNSPNALDGNYTEKCDTASAAFQSEETGLIDAVESEEEILAEIRQLVSLLPSNFEDNDSFAECTDDLNRACEDIAACAGDTSIALSRIADNGIFFETKRDYGKDVVTGLLRVNGMTVGAVANRTEVYDAEGEKTEEFDGTLSARGARKAAGFVKFCDAFDIPVLTLTNVTGFNATVCSEKVMAKSIGELVHAFASATVPKVNVIIGKAYGTAYVAMNSKSVGADIVYAWDNAEIGMMDASMAAKIMYPGSEASVINEKAAEYRELQSSVESAAARGYVDTVIAPADTRKYVIGAFEMLFTKREDRPAKKHGTV
ncbi:acyl-CoA carboxylase subunit beta [Blautia obeum]|uniref:acyl-CoA carboxylase subunit beta n=1 Tax=Blautia obeum TaxID=40520 RepID=UPI00156D4896|nr:carboxyl transferase domain-containing protein [Blautia obeum]NSG17874.1 carboxyl transferase [Blautia obeum]